MSTTVIRQLSSDVWTFSRPFARFGFFPLGGRSTAVKLQNGNVWVLASTPLDAETKTRLDEMGVVKYIIGPDAVHWLYLNDFKKAYPSAKLIGVEPLMKKPGCPKLDGAYGHDPPGTKYGFEDEITTCYFTGFANKDAAFYHARSKTAIMADLLLNLPANEQYSKVSRKPFLLRFTMRPTDWLHQKIMSFAVVDKGMMKRDVRTVASWDIGHLVPCHGDVIETDANEAWRTLYKAYL